MRHYMRMIAYFVKRVNLFPMPDQVEEESIVIDPQYEAVSNLPLQLIDWDEQEVNDLEILTNLVEAHTKEWIDGKIAQLKH